MGWTESPIQPAELPCKGSISIPMGENGPWGSQVQTQWQNLTPTGCQAAKPGSLYRLPGHCLRHTFSAVLGGPPGRCLIPSVWWSPAFSWLSAVSIISRVSGGQRSDQGIFWCPCWTHRQVLPGRAVCQSPNTAFPFLWCPSRSYRGWDVMGLAFTGVNGCRERSPRSHLLAPVPQMLQFCWEIVDIKVFQVMVVRHAPNNAIVNHQTIESQTNKWQPLPIYPLTWPCVCTGVESQLCSGSCISWLRTGTLPSW